MEEPKKDDGLNEELIEALEGFGIETTEIQRQLLLRHLELVMAKNKTINLTRITDLHSAIVLHIVDSLLLAPSLDRAPAGAFVDVGTGAGFPGIPLGIVTERYGLLVDSVRKKTDAVGEFIDALGLSDVLSTSHTRAEDLARLKPAAFSVVVARAVAQANVLIEYGAPLLKPGGLLVIAKGNVTDGEIAAGDRAADICGLSRVSRETYELPRAMGHREVISYRRTHESRVRLPRKNGMAKRAPLGI